MEDNSAAAGSYIFSLPITAVFCPHADTPEAIPRSLKTLRKFERGMEGPQTPLSRPKHAARPAVGAYAGTAY